MLSTHTTGWGSVRINGHLRLINPEVKSPNVRPFLSYLICCCERTGSTLLGNALIDTGLAGRPRSYFNRAAHYDPRMHRILAVARDDHNYLDKVIAAATTPNGVFGAKVHWAHFLNLIAKADRSAGIHEDNIAVCAPARLRVHFPDLRYIYLFRRNAVARAISHYRAKKTNRWQVDPRWTMNDTGAEGEPPFDFDQIDALVRSGAAEDLRWARYFQEHNIVPLEISYEELVLDVKETVRRVLNFLGIGAAGVNVPAPSLRIQADGRSREWEARYRRMCAEESA